MPPKQPKKAVSEMTSDELLEFVFPKKKTREKLKRIASAERPKRKSK